MQFDPHYIDGLVVSLNSATQNEQKLTGQLSSGLRVSSLSDDPVAAGQASMLNASISQDDRFVQTAATVQSLMQVTDSALGGVVTQLTSAISAATAGVNGTESSADLKSLAQQLAGIRDQVLSLANSSYQGIYIFAGSQGSTQPFTLDTSTSPASAIYHGDSQTGSITTTTGQHISTGLDGSAVFSAAGADVLGALNNLISDFATGTAGASSNTDLAALQAAFGNVTQQRTVLDSSLSRINTASSYAQTDATNRTVTASNLVAADPAKIATQLSATETQAQALMSAIAAVEKESLFSYM
ncbi:MAG TPA: flagellar hook-associated protein FlgL [Acidobacteriaceae bacterium]|nr:flagellar hook-associated protein FlgL [Acidobacteriaceae bacterium]